MGSEARPARAWSTDAGESDPHAFLQQRVTLFVKVLAIFFLIFTATGPLKLFAVRLGGHDQYTGALHMTNALVAGYTAALVALWLLLRRARRSLAFLHVVESATSVVSAATLAALVPLLPEGFPTVLTINLVVIALVLRAVVVPSSGRRTLVVGLLSTLVLTGGVWAHGLDQRDDGTIFTRYQWFVVLVWGVNFSAVTALSSRVIFGLRRRVHEALRLGNYTLTAKLGEGGMGVVFLARHHLLKRPSAVKLLPLERAGPQAVQRFEREVLELSRVVHPNTVAIYDFGRTSEGVFYYAMEYLDGLSLEELVALDGPQPPARVAYLLAQVAHVLAYAHGLGLIHRDIKPANIALWNPGGVGDVAKVLDFGLVKNIEAPVDASVTASGTITGTPTYLAPECLVAPEEVDGRADIYALGAVGYFLLCGRTVFEGRTVVEMCSHHLHSVPTPPSQRTTATVPAGLEAIVLRCLSKKPEDRHAGAGALHEALVACGAGDWGHPEATAWWAARGDDVRAHRERCRVAVDDRSAALVIARKASS